MTLTEPAPVTATPRRAARGPGRLDWSNWPRYHAAATGLRGYWYPVTWASKVDLRTYPVEQRLGMVWVYIGATEVDGEPVAVPSIDDQLPEELVHHPGAASRSWAPPA